MADDVPGDLANRLRILRVSRELLLRALGLPEGTKLVDVSHHVFFDSDEFAIKVAHPDFDPVPEGGAIKTERPVFEGDAVVKFVGWDK